MYYWKVSMQKAERGKYLSAFIFMHRPAQRKYATKVARRSRDE